MLEDRRDCTGDPARWIGGSSMFSMLTAGVGHRRAARTIVASCPHCFNALANEYPQLGRNYRVIHHTQLGIGWSPGKLTPVTRVEEKITCHDPCFLQ